MCVYFLEVSHPELSYFIPHLPYYEFILHSQLGCSLHVLLVYGTSLNGHFWRFVLGSKKTANFSVFKFPVPLTFTVLHALLSHSSGSKGRLCVRLPSVCVLIGDFQTLAGVFEIRFIFIF